MTQLCICGCNRAAGAFHHVVYVQELRRVAPKPKGQQGDKARFTALRTDVRNLVPVAQDCHGAHHNRVTPLELRVLPDGAYAFAAELLGPGPAYEYLRRRYAGTDARLDALLNVESEAA